MSNNTNNTDNNMAVNHLCVDPKKFEDLLGHMLSLVEKNIACAELHFTLADGRQYMLAHVQDCCESVRIEDVAGDLADLVGSPLTMAEEVSNKKGGTNGDSHTWTFYKLATVKGYVTVRFYGTSNGYYSEDVSFLKATSKTTRD